MTRLKAVIPFLALALLLIVLFWKALFLGHVLVAADTLRFSLPWADSRKPLLVQNWYLADTAYLFYPWYLYFAEMLGRGELPLWNPYSFSGHPLLANSWSGFLDPFNVLFFLNFRTAYNLRLILELYAAGVFTYLYLRRSLGLGRFGALLGGLLYMLNGVFVAWLEWQRIVGAALWLPLVLLFLDTSFTRRSLSQACLAGVALAASFLAGNVQMALVMLLTVLLYSAHHRGSPVSRDGADGTRASGPFLRGARMRHGSGPRRCPAPPDSRASGRSAENLPLLVDPRRVGRALPEQFLPFPPLSDHLRQSLLDR